MENQEEEYKKCKEDPWYFYVNYCLVDGEVPNISKESFDELVKLWESAKPSLKMRNPGKVIITSTIESDHSVYKNLMEWKNLIDKY